MTKRITGFCALFLLLLAPAAQGELRIEITQGVSEAVPIAVVPFGYAGAGRAPMDLAAVVFDAPEDAARALQFIEGLHQRGTLKIRNAAVLVADAEGNVTVKDTRDIDPKRGRLLGAVTGGVVGLVGGPIGAVVGALAGAGAGGLAGKKIDLGFPDQFLSGLKQYLQPDTSGLIVLVEHEYYQPLSEVIAEEEGVFFHQALTDRLVERLLAEGE